MQTIQYLKVKTDSHLPTIWAYTKLEILERDLRILYAGRYETLSREPVEDNLARTAQSFNSRYFKIWIEREQGRFMAFDLGFLVEKE